VNVKPLEELCRRSCLWSVGGFQDVSRRRIEVYGDKVADSERSTLVLIHFSVTPVSDESQSNQQIHLL